LTNKVLAPVNGTVRRDHLADALLHDPCNYFIVFKMDHNEFDDVASARSEAIAAANRPKAGRSEALDERESDNDNEAGRTEERADAIRQDVEKVARGKECNC
jgi:hypothetical protein